MSRYVTLGELLLRLSAPGHERLLQSPRFEASFGGGEANVAVSLAGFGLDAAFVSAIPPGAIGDAAVGELRRCGVDTSQILRQGQRLGLYYLEHGANQRPSRVLYDRSGSALATAAAGDFDWPAVFADAAWFHITGITPALSPAAAELTLEACRQARQHGVRVSCDLSFRASLWNYGAAPAEVMTRVFRLVDVGIGGREDCQRALGIGELTRSDADDDLEALTAAVLAAFPNLGLLALTRRASHSAEHHDWSACLRNADGFIRGPAYAITDIVDRVGAGDSFAAGLIYGLEHSDRADTALAFATAAGCLKHSIPGDLNRVSVAEVEELMAGDDAGRVRR